MATDPAMKIGEAAAALGTEAHVLRHWESVGLLVPPRNRSGHRRYDERILDYARLIRILQRTGLSLDQIRQLGRGAHEARVALVAARRAEVRDRIALLQATDRFLEHLTACSHPIIAECPECSVFTQQDCGAAAGVLGAARSARRPWVGAHLGWRGGGRTVGRGALPA